MIATNSRDTEANTPAVEQCRAELSNRSGALAALGLRFADPEKRTAASQLDATARAVVAQLTQDDDESLARQTCADTLNALWPHTTPELAGQPEWWSTPLGRLCARWLGRTDGGDVSHSTAAAMLNVHRGTVAQLVTRGTLERHPDGGVSRASVLQRIARAGGELEATKASYKSA